MTDNAVAVAEKKDPPKVELVTGADIRPIIPRDIDETLRLARGIIAAGLAPASYEKDGPSKEPDPQKVMIGILKGLEVGLPPITALSTIAIINKRPCIWGDGAVALCQQSGQVEWVKQEWQGEEGSEDWTAIFSIKRRGQDEPYVGTFSVRQAKRANLWGNTRKQPWIQYPQRMLMARARAYALREGFADCLSGLAIAEEVQDIPAEPQKVDLDFLEDKTTEVVEVADAPEEDKPTDHGPTIDAARDIASLGSARLRQFLDSLTEEERAVVEAIADELDAIASEADAEAH